MAKREVEAGSILPFAASEWPQVFHLAQTGELDPQASLHDPPLGPREGDEKTRTPLSCDPRRKSIAILFLCCSARLPCICLLNHVLHPSESKSESSIFPLLTPQLTPPCHNSAERSSQAPGTTSLHHLLPWSRLLDSEPSKYIQLKSL